MTDYSQYGEQARILEKLGFTPAKIAGTHTLGPEDAGRLLDIGAWHAKQFSNSRALIELGWSAMLVEPSPGPMRDLIAEYGKNPSIELVSAAATIDTTAQMIRLHVTDDALSTQFAEKRAEWEAHGYPFLATLKVAALPVTDFLDYGPFDFVNIDTEGSSVSLLQECLNWNTPPHNLGSPRPRVYCVEHDGDQEKVSILAEFYGYQFEDLGINALLYLPVKP